MKTPLIIVNFKAFKEAIGKNALKLARIFEGVSKEFSAEIGIAVQTSDIRLIAEKCSLPIFAQHIDAIEFGSFTGHILAESIKEGGAIGTLINHSERRIKLQEIKFCVEKCRNLNLISVVCTKDTNESKEVAYFSPNFIAVEPPELIGGDISVSNAKPEVIENTVKEVKKINKEVKVLCGAGIKNKEDVKKAILLGSEGILVASGVIKAGNVKEVIEDLVNGLS